MTGCNHGKSDDELTRKDLFDVIEIYKKENTELKKQIENYKEEIINVIRGSALDIEFKSDNKELIDRINKIDVRTK